MPATIEQNHFRQLLLANKDKKRTKKNYYMNFTEDKYTIKNVPHLKYNNEYGPDGEQYYLNSTTFYQVDKLLSYMKANDIKELSYTDKF